MEAGSIVRTRPDATGALRARLHGMWAAVAGSWGEHAEYVDTRGAGVTGADARRCRARSRASACSSSRAAQAAWARRGGARRAGRRGRPLRRGGRDDRDRGGARRRGRGSSTCSTRVLDLESIDEPDASYDVVLCREGLMFAPDPARAASEIRRVLRPGGRVAIAVWGPRERNPWLGARLRRRQRPDRRAGAAARRSRPVLAGRSPTVVALLAEAGLADVQISELPTPLRAGSFEEWWDADVRAGRTAGRDPRGAPRAGRPRALRERLREAVRPYSTATGVEIPGVTLIASARRLP